MDGLTTYQEMQDLEEAMEDASDLLDKYDMALPQAEYEYQTRLREVMHELRRTEGATMARETARGVPEVAELRKVRDELTYKMRSLRSFKEDLRAKLYVRKDMAQREWTRPSNQ